MKKEKFVHIYRYDSEFKIIITIQSFNKKTKIKTWIRQSDNQINHVRITQVIERRRQTQNWIISFCFLIHLKWTLYEVLLFRIFHHLIYNESTLDWQPNLHITITLNFEIRNGCSCRLSIYIQHTYMFMYISLFIIMRINELGECQFELYESITIQWFTLIDSQN